MKKLMTGAFVGVIFSVSAIAAPMTVSVTKGSGAGGGEGDFIAGSGIAANNFTIGSGPAGEEIALKARDRDFPGQPNSIVGNQYQVDAGMSSDSPTSPNLQFDFQYTPGSGTSSVVFLQLMVDFDPGVGSTNFATIKAPVRGDPATTWEASVVDNPGSDAFSDDSIPFALSQSWNLGFGFWDAVLGAATGYDPATLGQYEIRFAGLDSQMREILGTTILVNVGVGPFTEVPEPGTLALFGFGLIGLGFARRRKLA